MSKKRIYQLSDGICLRLCESDDCNERKCHWSSHLSHTNLCSPGCGDGSSVHFHCCVHRDIELVGHEDEWGNSTYVCASCGNDPNYTPPESLCKLTADEVGIIQKKVEALLNSNSFKDAKFIRLDDYYLPEISETGITEKGSKYWVSYDVKTTKSGKALLVLYMGNREDKSKCQLFIEPESKKLSHDHTDSDPLAVIARIEVEFKDGSIELKAKNDDAK